MIVALTAGTWFWCLAGSDDYCFGPAGRTRRECEMRVRRLYDDEARGVKTPGLIWWPHQMECRQRGSATS